MESPYCLLQLEKIIESHETFGQILLHIINEMDWMEKRLKKLHLKAIQENN